MVTMSNIKKVVRRRVVAYMKTKEIEIPDTLQITIQVSTEAFLRQPLSDLRIVGADDYLYDGDGANQIYVYLRGV